MADQDLNIHIKAQDETGGALKGLQGGVSNLAAGFEGAGRAMRTMGREIGQIGSAMMLAGTAITAPMLLAYKTAATYSPQIKAQIDSMTEQWDKMSISVGTSMLPVMQQLTNILKGVVDQWTSLSQAARDHLVQTSLVAGGYLLFGGIAVKSLGEILRVGGDIFLLMGRLIGSVNAVIGVFRTFGTVVTIVEGVTIPMWGIYAAAAAIVAAVALIPGGWKYVADAVQKVFDITVAVAHETQAVWDELHGNMQKAIADVGQADQALKDMATFTPGQHGGLANGIGNISMQVGGIYNTITQGASSAITSLNNVVNGVKGIGTASSDSQKEVVTFWQGFQMSIQAGSMQWNSFFLIGQDAGKQFVSSMTTDLSGFFDNVFTGQLNKASQVFANFGNSLIKIFSNVISQMISKWVSSQIGSMFSAGGLSGIFGSGAAAGGTFTGTVAAGGAFAAAPLMHDGGPVGSSWANPVVAHDGLAVDEVPAVLQSGEGVLSRQGMNNLAQLNGSGGMSGGQKAPTINITPVIQAWDASDVMRNMNAITNSIVQNIMNNGQIRTMMRQYQ